MGKKKGPEVSGQELEVRKKADEMLGTIQMYSDQLEAKQAKLEADLAVIRAGYTADLETLTEGKGHFEKTLKKFALKNRVDLFGVDGDKVSLSHGIILYAKADKVTIPKDAIDRITALGWKEGIKNVPTIDRPVIEAWNEEKLAAIGATKKPKEVISWELTANNAKSAKNLQAD